MDRIAQYELQCEEIKSKSKTALPIFEADTSAAAEALRKVSDKSYLNSSVT